jgi:release factor H-coupled RctB family protein
MNMMTTEINVRLIASAQSWMEGEAVRQLYATAKLEGMQRAVGFPDLHPGKDAPVGAAFVTGGLIYPHLIGGDIGCGMGLFQTDLVLRDAKLDRWAKIYFHLEHPWDGEVSEVLARQGLESTDFDATLGTIGGGNHFAEVQVIEEVLDAEAFQALGLGEQQLVLLVHSGSRGLGDVVLRSYTKEHRGNGVEAESAAGQEYLRGHDFAVRWARANRELIACRFAAMLGADVAALWDGCHNSITRREHGSETVWLHRKGAVAAEGNSSLFPARAGL